MNIVRVKFGNMPEIVDVENSLESLQSEVDGYIETVYPFCDTVVLICNEEGKYREDLLQKPAIGLLRGDDITDVIYGTCIIAGIDGEDFCSLSDDQCKRYVNHLKANLCIDQLTGTIFFGIQLNN